MAQAQKTKARLHVEHPDGRQDLIDEVKEFTYVSDMMAIGDTCSFTVVADGQGKMLRRLALGHLVRLELRNPAVNKDAWTLKHLGRIVERDASDDEGVIKVTSADLGWHLMNCHGPLYFRFRGLPLDKIVRPGGGFIDRSFGFKGVRPSNALNRTLKQGRAALQAEMTQVLDPVQVFQVEPGQSFYDCITTYAQRENLLLSVSVDGWIQLWNPDYERDALYGFYNDGSRKNVTRARRKDSAATRFTEVVVVGEELQLGVQLTNALDPNATKHRGSYRAPQVLPFTHRQTAGDAEMLDSAMAAAAAEWRWKRGLHDSHHLELQVPDHYQTTKGGAEWLESDHLADVSFPALSTAGRYYVQSVTCSSTVKDGDKSTLVLRWPHLLSAAYGVLGTRPKLSDPADTLALLPGVAEGQ